MVVVVVVDHAIHACVDIGLNPTGANLNVPGKQHKHMPAMECSLNE